MHDYDTLAALLPPADLPVSRMSRKQIAATVLYRDLLASSFEAWCCHVLAPLGQRPAAHHKLLIRELEKVASGETKRLMINLPPGSAKSTYGSVLFPAWALRQRPNLHIIGASNKADMAERFSRRVQGLIRDHHEILGCYLTREPAAQWETSGGGQYLATGVDGTIAGVRADLVLIDDPARSRKDVDSEANRDAQWNWFTADLRTRLKPEAAIVVIMTRWHEDDIGGRLLDRQPGLWRVVSLPAVAGDGDPLGRAPGEWLWDSDPTYGYGAELRNVHAEYEKAGAMRDWASLYQQNPRPAEGSLFKVTQIATMDAAPAGSNVVRGWDLAATKQTGTRDPDWTVGVKLMRTSEGRFVVLDVVRLRGGPDEVEAAIVNTAKQDGTGVRISLPLDPGQASRTQVLYYTRKLAGYRVESSPESGEKETRAAPVASQVNVGNFAVVKAGWNATFLDEVDAFPSGRKDDQVDALSRAFAMVGMARPPMLISPAALRRI